MVVPWEAASVLWSDVDWVFAQGLISRSEQALALLFDLPSLNFSLLVHLASLLEVRSLMHENEAWESDGRENELLGVHFLININY